MGKMGLGGAGLGMALLVVTGGAGCDGSGPLPPDNGGQTSNGGQTNSGTTTVSPQNPVGGALITAADAAALCQRPLGERLTVASITLMQETLQGAWVLCSPTGLFRKPQAGISIGANNRWAYLARSGDRLVAQTGLDNEGSLEFIDTSEMNGQPTIQVNFVSDLALTIIAGPPVISDVPRVMLIDNEGVESYTYAAVPYVGVP